MKVTKQDIVFLGIQILLFLAFSYDLEFMRILFPVAIFWLGVILFVSGALVTMIAVAQLNMNLSPFPSPLLGAKFVGNGLYKFERHPIYSGLFLAFLGYAIISDSGYRILISLLLLAFFYFKTQYEEKRLHLAFPEYEIYRKRTSRFFPLRIFRKQ